MTKFEEEAIKEAKKSKFIMNSYDGEFTASDIGLNIKLGRVAYNFPWLEFAKNWHSDEEFQELFDKYSSLNYNYEKEVIRSSKLETSNLKLIAEGNGLLSDNAMLTKKVEDLKSQLQQQALPVVPECVGEFIEDCKKEGDCLFGVFADATRVEHDMPDLVYFWLGDEGNNDELFARAWLDGYTVEKPQLFYLRDELTGQFLAKDNQFKDRDRYFFWTGEDPLTHSIGTAWKLSFTQEEIDSMETESYEQIEVAE